MGNIVLSLLMIAGIALLAGAWMLHKRGGERRRIILMVIAALVMFGNVAIWAIPTGSGESLAGEADTLERSPQP